MERLTKPAVFMTGNAYVSAIGSGYGAWPRIIQRLAAYENTGLEPEEISPKWIPVTERLPDKEFWEYQKKYGQDNMEVLVMIKGAKEATTLYYDVDGDFSDENGDTWLVTHWQPLPEPPKEV